MIMIMAIMIMAMMMAAAEETGRCYYVLLRAQVIKSSRSSYPCNFPTVIALHYHALFFYLLPSSKCKLYCDSSRYTFVFVCEVSRNTYISFLLRPDVQVCLINFAVHLSRDAIGRID